MSLQDIQTYYREVEKLKQYSRANNESVISQKFGDLINKYCEKRHLMLVPQHKFKTESGNIIIPDGTIRNSLTIDYGYWESKANVNLENEIRKKIKNGYPTNNILFEDNKTAILFQKGTEVKRCDIYNEIKLHELLTLFVGFEHPEVTKFNEAVEQFKKDIPKITDALHSMINKKEQENQNFVNVRNSFFQLCKSSINETITINDVNEMLIQHILTEDLFISIFSDNQFISENNIAKEINILEKSFFGETSKRDLLNLIKNYYEVIKNAANGKVDHYEKQFFLKVVYENFYKAYNPKGADKLGVVYTPSEIVKFMVESTDYLLNEHFNKSLSDKNVEILDPCTGTGTFITEIIEFIPKQYLDYKYKNEIHANEISILPYYISNLNIEYTFYQKMEYYLNFTNICFVDTLENFSGLKFEGKNYEMKEFSKENTERIKTQNTKKISVIIGNPPYNANQQNENDNNKNREYKAIDKRIKDTYIENSTAQKTKVYDMYVRFFRWASDRLQDYGIITFITNRNFIDGRSFEGFRKCISDEFDYCYIFDLKGDIRAKSDKELTTGNVFGIMTGITISFFVKTKFIKKRNCKILYYSISDSLNKSQKLDIINTIKINEINFQNIIPDTKNKWINLTENDFEELLPLVSKNKNNKTTLFKIFANGLVSNRDEWVYDFNENNLKAKMEYFYKEYNSEVTRWILYKKENKYQDTKSESNPIVDNFLHEKNSIKWSKMIKRDKLRKEKKAIFRTEDITNVIYRPFVKKYICDGYLPIDVRGSIIYMYHNHLNNKLYKNISISFHGVAMESIDFCCLSTKHIPDLQLLPNSQCVSIYKYNDNGNCIDNITDWGLNQFLGKYKTDKITKIDIFHYVYGVLHNPNYRKKYEINLKRDFPRIPFYTNFWQWANWGKELMELHLNYETIEQYPLTLKILTPKKREQKKIFKQEKVADSIKFEITDPICKLKADKDAGIIVLDDISELHGIPQIAWEYKLGNRSAMEWILDQYKESKPTDPTIFKNFNTYKFKDYKNHVIDLLKRVCTVSIKTVEIVKQMESTEI